MSIHFTRLANVTVDVPGFSTLTTPRPLTLSPAVPSVVLTVHRSPDPTQAATVELTVTDGCGTWQTFVGGGPARSDLAPRRTPRA